MVFAQSGSAQMRVEAQAQTETTGPKAETHSVLEAAADAATGVGQTVRDGTQQAVTRTGEAGKASVRKGAEVTTQTGQRAAQTTSATAERGQGLVGSALRGAGGAVQGAVGTVTGTEVEVEAAVTVEADADAKAKAQAQGRAGAQTR